jgi:hypothetical protein
MRHFPECTVPRRSRTQAQSAERYTSGYVSGIDQNREGVLGGTQGTYCDTTNILSVTRVVHIGHSRVVVLWDYESHMSTFGRIRPS